MTSKNETPFMALR